VTIIGGMLAATTVGLFVIPTLFAVIEHIAEWASGGRRRKDMVQKTPAE